MSNPTTPAPPPPQRVAFVTGASRGIGKGIALRLAREGKIVALCARSEAPLNELQQQIEGAGGKAAVFVADVADGKSLAAAIDKCVADLGRLDILINNAGITKDGLILRMSDEDWAVVLQTNLTSAFVACRGAARAMMKNRFGRIINIASTSGLVGNAGQANYAAAKAGLVGLTRTVARELGSKGITANVVAPGYIQTDMTENLPQEVKDHITGLVQVKRLGTVEDIAAAVSYVAADDAGFLTGQVLTVDGGMTMSP